MAEAKMQRAKKPKKPAATGDYQRTAELVPRPDELAMGLYGEFQARCNDEGTPFWFLGVDFAEALSDAVEEIANDGTPKPLPALVSAWKALHTDVIAVLERTLEKLEESRIARDQDDE